jgi:hypothetical protein
VQNQGSKTNLDLDDTFSKFRDPKIWFYKYMDLFENAGQVQGPPSGFHSICNI